MRVTIPNINICILCGTERKKTGDSILAAAAIVKDVCVLCTRETFCRLWNSIAMCIKRKKVSTKKQQRHTVYRQQKMRRTLRYIAHKISYIGAHTHTDSQKLPKLSKKSFKLIYCTQNKEFVSCIWTDCAFSSRLLLLSLVLVLVVVPPWVKEAKIVGYT